MKISYSMRQSMKSCPRKVFWKYYCGIELRSFSSPSKLIGSAFHLGLETIRKTKDADLSLLAARELILNSEYNWESINERLQNLARIEVYLYCYENYFFDTTKNWLSVEKEIITDNETAYIDGIMVEDGEIIVVEDKTRSFLMKNPEMILRHSDQLLNYLDLLQQIGINSTTCYYRETLKSKARLNNKNDESKLKMKLIQEYNIGDKFLEHKIKYTENEIDNYREEKKFYDRFIYACMGQNSLEKWPRFSDSCYNSYGQCEFLRLCSNDRNIQNLYKCNEKEPLDDGKMRHKLELDE